MKLNDRLHILCWTLLAAVCFAPSVTVSAQPAASSREAVINDSLNQIDPSVKITASSVPVTPPVQAAIPPAAPAVAVPVVTTPPPSAITPPATPPSPPPAPLPAVNLSTNEPPETAIEGTKIDALELKNMDLTDVLKLVAQKTGTNIVAGSQVAGKVTIFLKDVKLKDALHMILDANSFAYTVENGIVRVMPAAEFEARYGYKFGGNMVTRVIRVEQGNIADVAQLLNQVKSPSGKIIADQKSGTLLIVDSPDNVRIMEGVVKQMAVPLENHAFELTYASVKDVAAKVTEGLTPNVGSLKFDEVSKKIIINDTPLKIKELGKMIEAFDVKRREVLIEAKIIQVTLDDSHQYGVNWEQLVSNYNNFDLKSNFSNLGADATSGTVSIGSIGQESFGAVMQALKTVGRTDTLSSPRISALDNEEAKIMVGSSEPYVTSTTTTTASGPNTTAETVNFIDVGVKLKVTPTIHKDNFITLKIRPEISSATRVFTSSISKNSIPIKESSEAETTVMVKDGVTIVIGGLIKEDDLTTVNKVPLLGDVPLIKYAFRNSTKRNVKTEIVIFLTPHIISGENRAETEVTMPTGHEAGFKPGSYE